MYEFLCFCVLLRSQKSFLCVCMYEFLCFSVLLRSQISTLQCYLMPASVVFPNVYVLCSLHAYKEQFPSFILDYLNMVGTIS